MAKVDYGTNEEFITLFKELKNTQAVADHYGVSAVSIRNHAKKIGYDFTKVTAKIPKLTVQDKQDIIAAYYTDQTSTQLANKYNVSRGMITKIWYDAQLRGKEHRVYTFEHQDFFHTIDSEEKAYLLGFLCADGCIYTPKNAGNKQSTISFNLKADDIEILEYYRQYFGTNKPLSTEQRDKDKTYIRLEVSSEQMAQDLKALSIEPRKTYKNTWVELPTSELQFAFIRGYFDGDGSISRNFSIGTLHNVNVVIAGFKNNLDKFQQFLDSQGIQSTFIEDKREYNSEDAFGKLALTSKKTKVQFLKAIYPKDAKIYLTRKFVLAKKFIDLVQQ